MGKIKLFGVAVVAVMTAGFVGLPAGASPGSGDSADHVPVCSPSAAPGVARCGAIQLLDPSANWHGSHAAGRPVGGSGTVSPSGYWPRDIQSAYGLTSSSGASGSGQTVAIVDAYHDPTAIHDVGVYRKQFSLPALSACGSASPCITQVAQDGSTNYPNTSPSWSEEISLDLDMVSAVCPNCNILLVEATSNSFANLGTAENYAAAHATYVSNSYGGSEFSGESAYDTAYYNHPGDVITVSAGDSGYGVEYPAASPFVTAVGGTTLNRASNGRGWTETVWSGTGSGCSAYETAQPWQPSTSSCSKRTVADVSADANPNTGVAVYDTVNEPGWLVFGGTSVASPIIASVYALAHHATSAQGLYGAALNHVTSGTNARRCTTYLCNAADSLSGGYNGPTGNGTPNGTVGF